MLDVTLNSLVSLYFTSEDCEEFEYGKDKRAKLQKRDGKIFYKYAYGCKATDLSIRIACAIPFLELDHNTSISKFTQLLKDKQIINDDEFSCFCSDNYI